MTLRIEHVHAVEILDSRARPTLSVTRRTTDGVSVRAGVPSWRHQVAAWAEEPSQPMHAATVRSARAAFYQSVDTHRRAGGAAPTGTGGQGAGGRQVRDVRPVVGLELAREIGCLQ
jgi:hypothetical protein